MGIRIRIRSRAVMAITAITAVAIGICRIRKIYRLHKAVREMAMRMEIANNASSRKRQSAYL